MQLRRSPGLSAEESARRWRARLNVTGEAVKFLLTGVFGDHRPADRRMSQFFREHPKCGSQDRRFISRSCYTLLRYWGWLRKLLPSERLAALERGKERFSFREASGLLLAALLLDGSEKDAACELASALGVNLPGPSGEEGPAALLQTVFGGAELSFSLSDLVPGWLLDQLPAEIDREAFLARLPERPPMWLRWQKEDPAEMPGVLRGAGLSPEFFPRIPFAAAVRDPRINLFTLESYRNGDFEVQDLASMAIGLCASPRPRERWLDCCAGAGGKTLLLAQLMKRTGSVTASDIRAYKLDDLRARARRAGFPNIRIRPWDGKPFTGRFAESYDGVLVDAPCSCSGVWRRNPESRWSLTSEELAEFPVIQLQVLTAAAPAVRKGGLLVYATCSVFPAEDEEVVHAFLERHPDFSLEPFTDPLSGRETDGMCRFCGTELDCDSMFAARLRRVAR